MPAAVLLPPPAARCAARNHKTPTPAQAFRSWSKPCKRVAPRCSWSPAASAPSSTPSPSRWASRWSAFMPTRSCLAPTAPTPALIRKSIRPGAGARRRRSRRFAVGKRVGFAHGNLSVVNDRQQLSCLWCRLNGRRAQKGVASAATCSSRWMCIEQVFLLLL